MRCLRSPRIYPWGVVTVQTDAPHKLVFIYPGYDLHGTSVTGGAFGKGFFGGLLDGVAPEAQVVSVPFNPTIHSVVESLIVAVRHPQVDIATIQAGPSIDLNQGGSVFSSIANRLVERYDKPIFASAGNSGFRINYVAEAAAASKVIAVGSYLSRETSRVNLGVATWREDNIEHSSPGPRKDGGFKPNILAPTMTLSAWPGFLPADALPARTYNGTYDLPPGYGVGSGTSTAAPMAAAAAALLVSAAKQSNVLSDVDRLRWAMMSSARYLPEFDAHAQGAGLFQIGAAWEALKTAPNPTQIISRAPVNAVLSQYLKEPQQGVGIYEREGWSAGQTGQRTITFTRQSGSAKPVTSALRWVGNDGTYASPATINLPLNHPVALTVTISPQTSGAHSAILNLDELNGAKSIYQVMNTVVAAEHFTSASGFIIKREGQAEWLSSQSYFICVPPNTPALKVEVEISRGNAVPLLTRPSGYQYYMLASQAFFTTHQSGGTWSRIISRPDPGVWQIVVANDNLKGETRFAEQNRADFTVRAALLGAHPSQPIIEINPAAISASFIEKVAFTNRFSSFTGGVTQSPLGSAFIARPTLVAGEGPQVYEVNVPPGASSLSARISAASDKAADLDLYLFDCTGKECALKDFSARDGSNEQVEIENPAAGKWKVLMDPFSAPAGQTSCDYQDIFTHPAFGTITPTGKPALRGSGATWTEQVSVRVDAVPAGARRLAGFVAVTAKVGPHVSDEVVSDPPVSYPLQAVLGAIRIEAKSAKQ